MRRRRRQQEETGSQDRWLVSYADFITLLFAFFVVMYSISQVNESKYRVLSNTLTAVFNRPELSVDPLQVGEEARSNPMNLIELMAPLNDWGDLGDGGQMESWTDDLADIGQQLAQVLGNWVDQELVRIEGNENWLEIELRSSLLFASGEATLDLSALELLATIAGVLADHDHAVRVEGFTDDRPIQTPRFPSNWELSTARAAAVVRLLVEEGVSPRRLSAVGYGEFRPVTDNDSIEGRARNRRVVLKVSRQLEEGGEQELAREAGRRGGSGQDRSAAPVAGAG